MSLETRLATLIGAIGADIKALQAAGGGSSNIIDQLRGGIDMVDDFFNTPSPFLQPVSGAGASVTYPSVLTDDTVMGALLLNTGTSSTGYASCRTPVNAIQLGLGVTRYVTRVRLPTLSNATDRFVVNAGLNDITDYSFVGAMFTYEEGISNNWRCFASDGILSITVVDSGIAVAANTWYTLAVDVNAACTSAKFYINGTLVATITTTLPSVTGARLGAVMHLRKTAGTSARTMLADYMGFEARRTTLR